jgi:hypothetical protein
MTASAPTEDIYCWLLELPAKSAIDPLWQRALWLDRHDVWGPDAWAARRFDTRADAEAYMASHPQYSWDAVVPTDHIFIHSCREAT